MIVGIIPARYASTRFPGKPLADILGRSMIQRVYEQAVQSRYLNKVVVVTDDERILNHVKNFGGNAIITSENHPSGTDRCFEALQHFDEDFQYVINIQGDEPLINADQIDEFATMLDGSVELATQMIKVTSHESLFDRGEVKIVLNHKSEALYFSRMPIPYLKGFPENKWHLNHPYFRHAGMYAYRADILEQITKLPVSSLEKAESLEQLRWLEHGYKIKCVITNFESLCVDTPADLDAVVKRLS